MTSPPRTLVDLACLVDPARLEAAVEEAYRLLATVDFAWPKAKLVVEAEGFKFHSGRQAWERDLARYNSLVARGWRVIRLSWRDVGPGAKALADAIRAALRADRPR